MPELNPAPMDRGSCRVRRGLATLLALVCGLVDSAPASHADAEAAGTWSVTVIRVHKSASVVLPSHTFPALQGQVLAPLTVEAEEDELESAHLFEVRVHNRSRKVGVLRWDVSTTPYLSMPGKKLRPLGHKLHGFSESAIAVKGVLQVVVPPQASYSLFPVFATDRLPPRSVLVIDGVGRAIVPR